MNRNNKGSSMEDKGTSEAERLEERKRKRRNKAPLAFCSFLVKRPGLSFGKRYRSRHSIDINKLIKRCIYSI